MTKGKLNTRSIALAVSMLILGWGGTFLYYEHKSPPQVSEIRENSPEYKYINRLLIVDNSKVDFPELNPLQKKLEDFVDSEKSRGNATQVSVYFRDLNTSQWTGVNPNVLYDPSSMMKIITLLAYMKLAQADPEILNEKIYFEYHPDAGQHYTPQTILPSGTRTVKELLNQMIVESDNDSMKLLNANRPDAVLQVFKELGLPYAVNSTSDFMAVENYSRLFRTLYSATYLSRAYSEEALTLLTTTKFKLGLVSGVPAEIPVAHKFGEHTLIAADGNLVERELHDCGVVYYPNKPYLLCIMTKGKDFSKLESTISGISSLVYEEVSKP